MIYLHLENLSFVRFHNHNLVEIAFQSPDPLDSVNYQCIVKIKFNIIT